MGDLLAPGVGRMGFESCVEGCAEDALRVLRQMVS